MVGPLSVLLLAGILAVAPFDLKCEGQGTAPPQPKKPWEWTTEERLAVRLDPARIAERQSAQNSGPRPAGHAVSAATENLHSYSIDGRRHPELLLPHELFEALMTAFVPDDERRMRQRAFFRAGIVAMGFDEQIFWAQLSSVVSQYARLKYGEVDPGEVSASQRKTDDECRVRSAALTGARELFGASQFDRLLYDVVAPWTQVASASTSTDPGAELRRVADGCR